MTMRVRDLIQRRFHPEILLRGAKASDDLPEGVSGRILGRACVYGVPDAYGTMFSAGCFDRTRSEKVSSGKVQLFLDHDHTTRSHVGVVREVPDVGDALMMSADCFDSDAGQSGLDYCKSVLAANGFTGLSVGVYIRDGDWAQDPSPGAGANDKVYAFKEVELAEISITPLPAVPGTEVMHARRSPEERTRGQLVALRMLLTSIPKRELLPICAEFGLGELLHPDAAAGRDANGNTPTDSAIRSAATVVTTVPLEDRVEFVRGAMRRLHDPTK